MKTILLIEDNDNIRENTAEILELANYKVITATNGKAGLEKAIGQRPDLVICDIMMPELDGYGVLHALQKNDNIKHIPFIFLTAKAERSDFRKGMELGADDYLTKPFTGTELLNAVDGRIRKMEILRQELSPGIKGLEELYEASFGKNPIGMLTDGRNVNRYKKKQTIYTEGNHPNRLYYVLKGKVKTVRTNDDGKELITELYGPGDFLGYVPLLEGTVYRDTAETIEETELAVIPREDFEELLNSNREIAGRFIRLLAKNVSEKESQLLNIAYNSLRKKVAEALLHVRNKYQSETTGNGLIDISRENLATVAGTATESLIRTLGDFRDEGVIDIREGRITILDERKLANIIR